MTEYPDIPGLRIVNQLRSGGMGDVLLARKEGAHGFEKWIAVKTIRSELARDAHYREMFFDEARLMARLDHPSIVHVYDFGEVGDFFYLTMEYVSGLSFADLAKAGPLAPGVAVRLTAEAAKGLHAAHELKDTSGNLLNVVHRDVSPHNLFFAYDGHVKILDFGIALMRDREQAVTQVGTVKGKIAYMAPEQLMGKAVDRRSDVFALGVVLHELLTGKPLFGSGAVDAVRRLQGGEEVRPPSGIVHTIPRELDKVVLQSLAVDPAERFSSARAMAAALDKAAQAWPETTLESFAERELVQRREEHTAKLHNLLGGEASVPLSVRPPTVVDSTSPPRGAEPTTPLRAARTERTRIPRAAWIGAPVIVALASGAVWLGRDRPPSPPVSLTLAPPPPTPAPPLAVARLEEVAPETPAREKATPARVRPRAHAAPATPAPSPETFGFLTVGADPYALVRLDGRQVGVTPILRMKIPTGAHQVELVQPDNGEVRLNTSVSIAEGQERRVTTP